MGRLHLYQIAEESKELAKEKRISLIRKLKSTRFICSARLRNDATYLDTDDMPGYKPPVNYRKNFPSPVSLGLEIGIEFFQYSGDAEKDMTKILRELGIKRGRRSYEFDDTDIFDGGFIPATI